MALPFSRQFASVAWTNTIYQSQTNPAALSARQLCIWLILIKCAQYTYALARLIVACLIHDVSGFYFSMTGDLDFGLKRFWQPSRCYFEATMLLNWRLHNQNWQIYQMFAEDYFVKYYAIAVMLQNRSVKTFIKAKIKNILFCAWITYLITFTKNCRQLWIGPI